MLHLLLHTIVQGEWIQEFCIIAQRASFPSVMIIDDLSFVTWNLEM